MCGIVGEYAPLKKLGPDAKPRLEEALKLQNHRGPDASGIWANDRIQLGHNRLSIIDLSHEADQPFFRDDLHLRISFNGEIYNYKELKEDLMKKGYSFRTNSDTEVLLLGYHAYGSQICEKLTGMFAFAIWDDSKEELFLSRDRFGEKPLFYIDQVSNFYFASELGALRKVFSGQLTINHDAVIDLVEMMYIHMHHTIYNEVHNFPQATSLLINSKGEKVWKKYYECKLPVGQNNNFELLKKQTKEKLYQVVEKQLNADVPVATFLSAGVDSGLITAIASDIKPDLTAVTMSTAEESTDETLGAKKLASKIGVRHEIVSVHTDSLEHLSTIFKNIQPLADASLIPSHLVTNQVKGEFTVMLSGDGGDEVFGSYNRPNLYRNTRSGFFPFGESLVKMGLTMTGSLGNRVRAKMSDRNRMKIGGWSGLMSLHNLNFGLMQKVFTQGQPQVQQLKVLERLRSKFAGYEDKLSFGVDLESRLPADFLYKIDSAAMHSSVEVRAPFLDHKLADFLMQTPVENLMPNQIDKELSKSLLSDYTGEIWSAPKKGFTIPYWQYLRGEWGDVLESYLREGLSKEYFFFNVEGILELLNSLRMKHSIQYGRVLFAVLVLEIWLREFHLKK